MQVIKQSMPDFMADFGKVFFEKASASLNPTYVPGTDRAKAWDQVVDVVPKSRPPFPGQRTIIAAVAAHLFGKDKRATILSADMGTGKTLMAGVLAAIGTHKRRPQRVIAMVPPHLVGKWIREVEKTIPGAKAYGINDAGSIARLERAARENPDAPKTTEFWITGRVRARMGFSKKSGMEKLEGGFLDLMRGDRQKKKHLCPDCGRPVVVLKTEREVEKMTPDEQRNLIYVGKGEESAETGEGQHAAWPDDTYFEKGRKSCDWVYHKGSLERGCGTPLWQATRRGAGDQETLLVKALEAVDGIGNTKAKTVAACADKDDVVADLCNGVIHPTLYAILGKSASTRAHNHIMRHGFSGVDGNYAISEFIKRQLPKGWFDISVFDELHELDGDNTAQGVAMGVIAGCTKKIIGLTGTLVDGYAGSLFPLLFRINPRQMLRMGYKAGDAVLFQREKGVIKELVTEDLEDDFVSSKGRKKVTRLVRNLPGLHPSVITDFLLPNAVFVELQDMEEGVQEIARKHGEDIRLLPSYRETYVSVNLRESQVEPMKKFTTEMVNIIKAARRTGNKKLMGRAFYTLLYAADGCFEPVDFEWFDHETDTLCKTTLMPDNPGEMLEKEKIMLELALREKAAGRRLLVYSIYTDKRNLLSRYHELATQAGLRSYVLRSSVPTHKREAWIEEVMEKGCDIVFCNQEIVKTGLDMLGFQSIFYMQTGYSTNTILQSAKRSWRIGQTAPIRTYFSGYANSPQMNVLKLVAKKLNVSNQAKGNIAETSLSHLAEDDEGSSLMAMANQILESIRDKDHDPIVGSISSLAEDHLDGEYGATAMHIISEILRREYEAEMPKPAAPKFVSQAKQSDPMDILARVFATANRAVQKEHEAKPVHQNTIKRVGNSILVDDPYDLF
ncbi:MAG: hypothetical protein ACYDCW_07645 [Acidithiobacillus ferrivorans]